MSIIPYLCVADARRAIDWYVTVLGARVTYQPIVMDDGRIGHAEFAIGDAAMMMAEPFPELGGQSPRPDGRRPGQPATPGRRGGPCRAGRGRGGRRPRPRPRVDRPWPGCRAARPVRAPLDADGRPTSLNCRALPSPARSGPWTAQRARVRATRIAYARLVPTAMITSSTKRLTR